MNVAFADWLETIVGIAFLPNHVTAYRMERGLAEIEAQMRTSSGHKQPTTQSSRSSPPYGRGRNTSTMLPTVLIANVGSPSSDTWSEVLL